MDDFEDEMLDKYLDAMLDENANEEELWDLMNLRRKTLRETYFADMVALVELRPNEKQNGKDQEDRGDDGKGKRTMVLSELKTTALDTPSGVAPPPDSCLTQNRPPSSCLTQSADSTVEVRQLSPPSLTFPTKDPCFLPVERR